jgi:hypothetical protein
MDNEERNKLIEITAKIKDQPDSMKEFAADPLGYLKRLGLNVEGLTLTLAPKAEAARLDQVEGISENDLAMIAGGACFTLGHGVCYTEGEG